MSAAERRLIVLDRDGVINVDSHDYVKSPAEWRALPRSLDAIARLGRAGYDVVVATNQSGVGRGLYSEADVDATHARMREAVADAGGEIRRVYVCPHRPEEGCNCRKPMPGLLHQVAEDFQRSLEGVPFVGDKVTDVEAAVSVGARPILVLSGIERPDLDRARALGAEVRSDLAEAVDWLLRDQGL